MDSVDHGGFSSGASSRHASMRHPGAAWRREAAGVALLLALVGPPRAAAEPAPRLWVLEPPALLAAYDLADFSRRDTLSIPRVAFTHPDWLKLGARQALLPLDDQRLWIWDGAATRTLSPHSDVARPGAAPGVESLASPRWLLTADRGVLVAVNDFSTRTEGSRESIAVATTRFHVDLLDLEGARRGRVLEHAFEPCSCRTGACDETCPQGDAWAPGGVAGDFFYVNHWVPGQLSSEYRSTFLCRRGSRGWHTAQLSRPIEQFLDAADSGSTWVEAQRDGGCCGWQNGSSDRAAWVYRGKSQLLFDEWARYHNQDYDVSIYPRDARIAPGGRRVAFTVTASESAGAAIRLSSDGHADTVALAAIRKTLAELPLVEVQEWGRPSPPILRLPRAELVGWSSRSEIVVVQDGRLMAVDVSSLRRRESTVRVRSAADAFLIRP